MSSELLYYIIYTVIGSHIGQAFGMWIRAGVLTFSATQDLPECGRFLSLRNNADICALANESQPAYVNLNASTLQVLNAMAHKTGQQSIADQIVSIRSACDSTLGEGPNPDEPGGAACKRFNETLSNSYFPLTVEWLILSKRPICESILFWTLNSAFSHQAVIGAVTGLVIGAGIAASH